MKLASSYFKWCKKRGKKIKEEILKLTYWVLIKKRKLIILYISKSVIQDIVEFFKIFLSYSRYCSVIQDIFDKEEKVINT